MKYLIAIISIISITSCNFKVIPDGEDEKGFYRFIDSCVLSHSESRSRVIMIGKVMSVQPYSVSVCDSYETVKSYIPLKRIKRQ